MPIHTRFLESLVVSALVVLQTVGSMLNAAGAARTRLSERRTQTQYLHHSPDPLAAYDGSDDNDDNDDDDDVDDSAHDDSQRPLPAEGIALLHNLPALQVWTQEYDFVGCILLWCSNRFFQKLCHFQNGGLVSIFSSTSGFGQAAAQIARAFAARVRRDCRASEHCLAVWRSHHQHCHLCFFYLCLCQHQQRQPRRPVSQQWPCERRRRQCASVAGGRRRRALAAVGDAVSRL
jgi:hypothetical protein